MYGVTDEELYSGETTTAQTATNTAASVVNPADTELQAEILKACKEDRDVSALVEQLNGAELNCADELGRSPLHIAVLKENEKMVKDLLEHSSEDDIQHCFLFATAGPFRKIATVLKKRLKDTESYPYALNTKYRLPLVLAAEKNLYKTAKEIEGILPPNAQCHSGRKETQTTEDWTCCEDCTMCLCHSCEVCQGCAVCLCYPCQCFQQCTLCICRRCCCCCQKRCCDKCVRFLTPARDDPVVAGLQHKQDDTWSDKVHYLYYKGVANEAFLTLTYDDPITAAFQLHEKLADYEDQEYYKDHYKELGETLSRYSASLLDYIRSDEEKDVILRGPTENKSQKWKFPGGYIRLRKALDMEEKLFVAHSICQEKVDKLWKGTFPWELHCWRCILLYTICGIVAYPFLALIHMVYPCAEALKLMKAPCVKFWAQFYFYVIRLSLIFSFSLIVQPFQLVDIPTITADFANMTHLIIDSETGFFRVRRDFGIWPYYLVFILILGIPWWELAQWCLVGAEKYFMSLLNWIDIFKVAFYVVAFVFHVIKLVRVKAAIRFFLEDYDGNDSNMTLLETNNSTTMDHAYWLTPDRFYWVHNDWEILSEGFFAIANILDFARFVQVFVVIRSIGTLLMPFKNMTQDIFRFIIAFLLFFGAFMVGQTNLYWYYDSRKRSTVERISHVEPSVSEKYTDLFSSLAYSFWSLFGMGDREGYHLQEFKEIDFTQRLGAVFYGAFLVICVLALLNILIAMFVDSYASYQCGIDTENTVSPGSQAERRSYKEVMLDIRVRYIQDVYWSALSREYLRIEKLRSANIANTGDSTA